MSATQLRPALRHLFAWAATTGIWLLLWTITYLFLLLWALLANQGIGNPSIYPLGLLAIFLLHSGASLLVFLPATLLAEFLCSKQKLPKVRGGIPLAFCFYILLVCLLAVPLAAPDPSPEQMPYPETALALFLSLAVPMGFYWWASQFPSLLRLAFQKISGKLRPQQK